MDGFVVTDSIQLSNLGISASNTFVTIRDTYHASRVPNVNNFYGAPGPAAQADPAKPFVFNGLYFIFAQTNIAGLQPLKQEPFMIQFEAAPANPTQAIYQWLKENKFAGLQTSDHQASA